MNQLLSRIQHRAVWCNCQEFQVCLFGKVFDSSSGVEGCVVKSYNKRRLSIMNTYASGLAEFFQEVYYYFCVNRTVNSHHAVNLGLRNCCYKAHWELINGQTYVSLCSFSSPSIEIALAGAHFKLVNINYFCTHFLQLQQNGSRFKERSYCVRTRIAFALLYRVSCGQIPDLLSILFWVFSLIRVSALGTFLLFEISVLYMWNNFPSTCLILFPAKLCDGPSTFFFEFSLSIGGFCVNILSSYLKFAKIFIISFSVLQNLELKDGILHFFAICKYIMWCSSSVSIGGLLDIESSQVR